MHLVGFIIRTYEDARLPERQKLTKTRSSGQESNLRYIARTDKQCVQVKL